MLVEHSPTDAVNVIELCQCLERSNTITALFFKITRNFHVREAQLFAKHIRKSKLQQLSISRCPTTWSNVEVNRHICKGIKNILTLEKLEFDQIFLDRIDALPGIMRYLKSLQQLTIQKYGACPRSLCVALSLAPSLTTLKLEVGGLREADMRRLSAGLNNSNVTKLRLYGSHLDDSCVQAFVELWSCNSLIKELDLGSNFIGPEGALLLLRAGNDHAALETLKLSNNPIGYPGLVAIGELLPTSNIKNLCILFCWTDLADHDDEVNAETDDIMEAKKRAAQSLLAGIKLNMHMNLVIFGGTVTVEAEQEIAFYSDRNRKERYLLSLHDELAPAVWCHVMAKLNKKSDQSVVYFFLREQPYLWCKHHVPTRLTREPQEWNTTCSLAFSTKFNINIVCGWIVFLLSVAMVAAATFVLRQK